MALFQKTIVKMTTNETLVACDKYLHNDSMSCLVKVQVPRCCTAIPAHLFAGIWGTLAVPLTNPDTTFGAQFLGVISINVFVFIVSLAVWGIMKSTIGIRLSKEAELKGTDVVETGVIGYAIRD